MITMDDIVREGHPVLRKTADEVKLPIPETEKNILIEMIEFVKMSQDPDLAAKHKLRPGVGLAAPQINVSKRMIAVHVHDHHDRLYSYALINPKIISHSVEKTFLNGGEGCLSVDRDVPGIVPRYARITVKGIDLNGEEVKIRLKGMPGIVFQHEIDHLNGIMFYDHIDQQDPFKVPENAVGIDR